MADAGKYIPYFLNTAVPDGSRSTGTTVELDRSGRHGRALARPAGRPAGSALRCVLACSRVGSEITLGCPRASAGASVRFKFTAHSAAFFSGAAVMSSPVCTAGLWFTFQAWRNDVLAFKARLLQVDGGLTVVQACRQVVDPGSEAAEVDAHATDTDDKGRTQLDLGMTLQQLRDFNPDAKKLNFSMRTTSVPAATGDERAGATGRQQFQNKMMHMMEAAREQARARETTLPDDGAGCWHEAGCQPTATIQRACCAAAGRATGHLPQCLDAVWDYLCARSC